MVAIAERLLARLDPLIKLDAVAFVAKRNSMFVLVQPCEQRLVVDRRADQGATGAQPARRV